MEIKNRLMSNTSYLFLNWGVMTLSTMVFWIILGKTLSPQSYGVSATALQIASLISTVTLLGVKPANEKLLPELIERDRKDKVQGLINFSFKLVFVTSILAGVSLFLLSSFLSPVLGLDSVLVKSLSLATIVTSLAVLFGSYHYGFQNMKRFFLGTLLGEFTFVVSVILFVFLGFDYWSAVIAYTLCFSVSFLVRFSTKMFKISEKPIIDKSLIFNYALPSFIVVLLSVLFNKSHYIILSTLKGTEVTGFFAVAMKISSVLYLLPTIFSRALLPITSGLSIDSKSGSKQSYLISLVFRYTILIVLPLALFMIFFSKYLILFFSTAEYLVAMEMLPVLVLGAVFVGFSSVFSSSLYAIGEPKKYMFSHSIAVLVYLVTSIILTFRFSGLGLSFAYLISSIVMLLTTFSFIKKRLDMKFPPNIIVKILFSLAMSFLFLLISKPFIPNLWIAGIYVVISGGIYLSVLLITGVFVEEDLKILDFLIERAPIFSEEIRILRDYLSNYINKSYREEV